MPTSNNDDLDNNAPDNAGVALIIIDMINDLEFPGGDKIFAPAVDAAKKIAALAERARTAGVPVIFANDNFGRWRSNFNEAIDHCLNDDVRGGKLAQILRPDRKDYFILKPKHSAFYSTPLLLLLQHLKCKRLILCGISGDMCVQFTACDAYVRDFEVAVPRDCMASNTLDSNEKSLQYMENILGADLTPSTDVDFKKLRVATE